MSKVKKKKICKLLQKVKSDFQDALFYFLDILPKFRSVVFVSINYINETIFNSCAATNCMYFISHNSFAFNHKLNGSLFWKAKIHTNRKGLRQLAFAFIDNMISKDIMSNNHIKMNPLNINAGLKVSFWNVKWAVRKKVQGRFLPETKSAV